MNRPRALWIPATFIAGVSALLGFQKPFREYPAQEYNNFPVPADGYVPAEFVFARLMYESGGIGYGRGFGFGRFGRGDWREGYTDWTNDYPRSDRHLMVAVRRLSRINNRSVEQPVNLDDGDDVFNWPFLYAARGGYINLNESQNSKLRDYLDRGGFLVTDDAWGDREFEGATEMMKRVYPERTLEELGNDDLVFHTVFDLNERYQILGQWSRGGQPLNGGYIPHWLGLYDDKKRMMAGVWVNNDTGDSWEWADDPSYPERFSALGIRIMLNHIVYAMTH